MTDNIQTANHTSISLCMIANKEFDGVTVMQQGTIVDFDLSISLASAKLSLELKIPMSDSIMLATARSYNATL